MGGGDAVALTAELSAAQEQIVALEKQVQVLQQLPALTKLTFSREHGAVAFASAEAVAGGWVEVDGGGVMFDMGDEEEDTRGTTLTSYHVGAEALDLLQVEVDSAESEIRSLVAMMNEDDVRYEPEQRRTVHRSYMEAVSRRRTAQLRQAVLGVIHSLRSDYEQQLEQQRHAYEVRIHDYQHAEPERIAKAVHLELLEHEPRYVRTAALGEARQCVYIEREAQGHATGHTETPKSLKHLKRLATTDRVDFDAKALPKLSTQIDAAESEYITTRNEIESMRQANVENPGAVDPHAFASATQALAEQGARLGELKENAAIVRFGLDVAGAQAGGMQLDARTTTVNDLSESQEDIRRLRRMLRAKYSTPGGSGGTGSKPPRMQRALDDGTPADRTRGAGDPHALGKGARDWFWTDPTQLTVEQVLERLKETESIVDLCIAHHRLAATHYVKERTKWTVDVKERERMIARYERELAGLRQRDRETQGTPTHSPTLRALASPPPGNRGAKATPLSRPSSAPVGSGGRAAAANRKHQGRGTSPVRNKRPATASGPRKTLVERSGTPVKRQVPLDQHYLPAETKKFGSQEQESALLDRLYDKPLRRILNPPGPPPIAEDPGRRSPKHGQLTGDDMMTYVNNNLYYTAVDRQRRQAEQLEKKWSVIDGKREPAPMDKGQEKGLVDKLYTQELATQQEKKDALFRRHVLSKEKTKKKFRSQDDQQDFFEKMYAAKKK